MWMLGTDVYKKGPRIAHTSWFRSASYVGGWPIEFQSERAGLTMSLLGH
jgi:hypothetical protein